MKFVKEMDQMMTNKVKIPDEFYVGINSACKTASGKPLGFATPNGDDAAANKRKSTVDSWVTGYHRDKSKLPNLGKIYANLPRRGFKLVDWSSRYCTDNKVARILDPYGYELEIYIPNLMNLILSCDINKGDIDAELIWIREGAHNRLVRSDDPIIEEAKKAQAMPKPKKLRHKPGDIIECNNVKFLYLGLLDVEYIIPAGDKVTDKQMTSDYNNYNYYTGSSLFGGIKQRSINYYYKLLDDVYNCVHIGRKHVYMSEDCCYNNGVKTKFTLSKQRDIEFRSGQMTTYNIVSSGNELPEFNEDIYWRAENQMYYTEQGEVLTFDALHAQHNHFYNHLNIDYWIANIVRFQDGKMTAPVDQKKMKKILTDLRR